MVLVSFFSVHSHNDLANVVRSSEYFTSIPVLPVECAETDGDVTSTPIVFEDIFCDARPAQKCRCKKKQKLSFNI